MSTNQRLFYNKFKYRIRFFLRRGVSLLRTCYKYTNEQELLDTLRLRQEQSRAMQGVSGVSHWSDSIRDIWSLDKAEIHNLLLIFAFREMFDPVGKVRVESPAIDFYTNNVDYIKRAEDTGIESLELCQSLTDEPNIIVTDKLPFGIFNLKCMTRYTIVGDDIIDALLNYQDSGEIKFPWTWETRRYYSGRVGTHILPEYIYAMNEESIPMVNLIAGPVINNIYSYKIV